MTKLMMKIINKNSIIMNKIAKLLFVILIVSFPMFAKAQNDIEQAMDKFMEDNASYISIQKYASTPKVGKKSSTYLEYSFEIPKSKSKQIDEFVACFRKDSKDAYVAYDTKVGESWNASRSNILYGNDLEYSRTFCNNPSQYNYVWSVFHDTSDSLSRYAYEIGWNVFGKKIKGCVIKIYGLDPNRNSFKRNKVVYSSADSGISGSYVLDSLKIDLENFDRITSFSTQMESVAKKMEVLGKKMENTKDLKELGKQGKEMESLSARLNYLNTEMNRNGLFRGASYNARAKVDTVYSDVDFFRQFGFLRSLYMKEIAEKGKTVDSDGVLTALVNKIVVLCKKGTYRLTNKEKEPVINAIIEMHDSTTDSYVRSLLDMSQSYMK